jgi:ATP-binding cassette subfamily B protein
MYKFLIHRKVQTRMNYKLKTDSEIEERTSIWNAVKKMGALLLFEKKNIAYAIVSIIVNSGMTLLGPLLVGYTINNYVLKGDYHGVIVLSLILLGVYAVAAIGGYTQTRIMGAVGQRTLFRLRNSIFTKLQELPLAFFNQNKAGDLISRINNDTDKLNQFFSQSLMQFMANAFTIVGAAIFIVVINYRLGLAALMPALFLLILTRLASKWIKKINLRSLQATGELSSEIQESLENFKVIIAFNRRDYFKKKFEGANTSNYNTAIVAGLGNNLFMPVYDFAANIAQLIVLVYGIHLVSTGSLAIGLLVSFILYIARFYDPLRSFASFWSTMQIALAGWERISEINRLESDLIIVDSKNITTTDSVMRFENVSFIYPEGKSVLQNVNFNLGHGKTYALVGPTGGGKTTTASLIARLFDPTSGTIYLNDKDIRSYSHFERSEKIGFILQEPFIFSGKIIDNIIYGNRKLENIESEDLEEIIKKEGLDQLLKRFENGLDTDISGNNTTLSLGQKQIIAFIRAVLRNPEILILDEATANIDTVTEQILQDILKKLPSHTTRIVIAHRLNTIENADEIFFVNGGAITAAGSIEHAMDMLLHHKRTS